MLHVETNYGVAEEWVTITSKPANPPAFVEESRSITAYLNEPVDIQLQGLNTSPTADYSIRDIRWDMNPLPEGLMLDSKTGRLTGTPIVSGSFTSKITCTTNQGSASQLITWKSTARGLPAIRPWLHTASHDGVTIDMSQIFPNRSRWENKDYTYMNVHETQNKSSTRDLNIGIHSQSSFDIMRKDRWGITSRGILPLPGELGEIFKREVLVSRSSTNGGGWNGVGDYPMRFHSSSIGKMYKWISPVVADRVVSVSITWRSANIDTNANAYALDKSYKIGNLEITLRPRAYFGYSASTKKRGPTLMYKNHLWVGIEIKNHGILMLPCILRLTSFAATVTPTYTPAKVMPDYSWDGNYMPIPEDAGEELILP